MTQPHMCLFSRIADPAKAIQSLRELGLQLDLDGPDDSWGRAVVRIPDQQTLSFTFTRESDDDFDPDQSPAVRVWNDWVSPLPDTESKSMAMMVTSTFKLVMGIQSDPDFDFAATRDPRLPALFAVCGALDGILMTRTELRDAEGRILLSGLDEDDEDPGATWPKVIASVSIGVPVDRASEKSDAIDVEVVAPPTAEQVVRRALALAAVTARAMLEQHPDNLNMLKTWKNRPRSSGLIPWVVNSIRKSHPNPLRDLFKWIELLGIGDDLEPNEWEVLQRPLGHLDSQMFVHSVWRLEGLVVLSWALGGVKMPPHDQLVEFYSMWEFLGLLDANRAKELLESPILRSRGEIEAVRRQLFAIHWRLRNFDLHHEVLDFAKFAKECWFGPLDISGLPLADGDLALGGVRLDQASDDSFSAAHSTALERHMAANWLWEGPARYSDASQAT